MTRRDWTQPVLDLLHCLQGQQITLTSVDDGEESMLLLDAAPGDQALCAVDAICSVDASWLRVMQGQATGTLFIVLGNEPDELVADYGCTPSLEPVLEQAIEQHRTLWGGLEWAKAVFPERDT